MKNGTALREGKYIATTYFDNSIIEIQPDGSFCLSIEGKNPRGLAKSCAIQYGTYIVKGDTLILNTDIQGRFDDYFTLEGYRNDDSIEIIRYSINTADISDEPVVIADYGFCYPDSNGRIVLSCSQKKLLTLYVQASLSTKELFGSDEIKCGGRYKFYVKDCYPTIYNSRKFLIMDSGILDCKHSILYRYQVDNNTM